MKQAVAYIRVSTAKHGKIRLCMGAQREAIERFAAAEGIEVAAIFTEVETGKGSDVLDFFTSQFISHVFLFNAASNKGFLLSDFDTNDTFETAIVLAKAGSATALD